MGGDLVGAVIRDIAHPDAALCGGGSVDVVDPDAQTADQPAVGHGIHHLTGDLFQRDDEDVGLAQDGPRFSRIDAVGVGVIDILASQNAALDGVARGVPEGVDDMGCHLSPVVI